MRFWLCNLNPSPLVFGDGVGLAPFRSAGLTTKQALVHLRLYEIGELRTVEDTIALLEGATDAQLKNYARWAKLEPESAKQARELLIERVLEGVPVGEDFGLPKEAKVEEPSGSDYSALSHDELVALCQERGISARGKDETLIAKLEANDGV